MRSTPRGRARRTASMTSAACVGKTHAPTWCRGLTRRFENQKEVTMSLPNTWQCSIDGYWNIGHHPFCTACELRREAIAGTTRCWAYTKRGSVCGEPAVGIDYDIGMTVCEEHLPAHARAH